jgi:hypothetical protein
MYRFRFRASWCAQSKEFKVLVKEQKAAARQERGSLLNHLDKSKAEVGRVSDLDRYMDLLYEDIPDKVGAAQSRAAQHPRQRRSFMLQRPLHAVSFTCARIAAAFTTELWAHGGIVPICACGPLEQHYSHRITGRHVHTTDEVLTAAPTPPT